MTTPNNLKPEEKKNDPSVEQKIQKIRDAMHELIADGEVSDEEGLDELEFDLFNNDEDDDEEESDSGEDNGEDNGYCFNDYDYSESTLLVSLATSHSTVPVDYPLRHSKNAVFWSPTEHYLQVDICSCEEWNNPQGVEVTVENKRCHTILRHILRTEPYKAGDNIVVAFDLNELFPIQQIGKDVISLTIRDLKENKILYDTLIITLHFNSIFDALKIERAALYPAPKGSSSLGQDTTNGYVAFAQQGLGQINVNCLVSSTTKVSLDKFDIQLCFYNQEGVLLSRTSMFLTGDDDSVQRVAHNYISPSEGEEWKRGEYKVALTAFRRTIVSVSFKVGDFNLEGEVDVPQVISMLKAVSKVKNVTANEALERLGQLVGLKSVKEKISSLSRLATLTAKRKAAGLPIKGTSLHACFMGNPGTGKSAVAEIIGQIYKNQGLLSSGHVVSVERRNLVGRYYDSELRATEQAIESARGGILFIDQAYNLFAADDPHDPGKRVLEALLTALSNESNRDWMLILSGYSYEMERMLDSNPGLNSMINERFYFDDYDVEELMKIADLYCQRNKYKITAEARRHLHSVVMRDYNSRDKNFGNARYINNLLEQVIVANMAQRISRIEEPTIAQLQTIEKEDIPSLRKEGSEGKQMARLNDMVGLVNLKTSIAQHLNMVKLANMRMRQGLHTEMPPLHMIFTGNPGTGKTTVADFLGEIYASMGLLSKGDVIRVEKRDLVGSHVGETEQKMNSILNRAKGNILFIDEAYQLYSKDGQNDYGANVVESLLTTLSNDNVDMIVILAGYPKDMERMLDMNDGLRSRFPYTFHFEDYSVEELHKIALLRAKKDNYTFTKRAEKLLTALIKREVLRKRSSFGNARFVTRLLSSEILPRMATRLANISSPTKRQLQTIVAEDIPITKEEVQRIERGGFDDEAIDNALKQLDNLVGQQKVKRAIHNFVDVARYLNSRGERFVGKGLLKWNFAGSTGTGKSTVAVILANILKAMNLLDKGNIVEVRGEQIFNVSEYQCDQVLRQAMERSRYGMLFIDGDAPEFRNMQDYRLTNEQLRIKLTSLTTEMGGTGAVIIAECNSPRQTVANSLAINGIYDFDHTFFFDDYTAEELFEILCRRLKKHNLRFEAEAEAKMRQYIETLCNHRDLSFANARTMKHLARTIYEQVVLRASRNKGTPHNRVLLEDVENYTWHQPKKLGY